MCTAFPYCRVGVQRLLEMIYAIIFTGGFVAGPRTLRPERLQWLTTSAANRLASMRNTLWSSGVGLIAQAAPNRSIHRVDTVRSGALEELSLTPKDAASLSGFGGLDSRHTLSPVIPAKAGTQPGHRAHAPRLQLGPRLSGGDGSWGNGVKSQPTLSLRRASAHFFHTIVIRHEAWHGTFPPAFLKLESGAALS